MFGIVRLATGKASSSFRQPLFTGSSTSPSSYALALYSGLWAFDGWDQANYVGGEISRPEKNIPRAIHSSMIIVTVCCLYLFKTSANRHFMFHSFYFYWLIYRTLWFWTRCAFSSLFNVRVLSSAHRTLWVWATRLPWTLGVPFLVLLEAVYSPLWWQSLASAHWMVSLPLNNISPNRAEFLSS